MQHVNYPSESTEMFVKQLILEYKVFSERPEFPYLWTIELDNADRKVLLSYACSAEDYEYFCGSIDRLISGYNEYDDVIQNWIDKCCYDKQQEIIRGDGIRYTSYNDLREGNSWAINW
jgi:hypothetical protein